MMAEVARSGDWLARRDRSAMSCSTARAASSSFLPGRDPFPGLKIAELCGIAQRPPVRGDRPATSSTSTARTTGGCASCLNPALTPRAADPPPAGDEGDPPRSCSTSCPADGACEFVTDFAKPYPSLVIAHLLGIPDRGRSAAARLVELDPAPVRRRRAWSTRRCASGSSALGGRVPRCWAQQMLARKRAAPGDEPDHRAARLGGRRAWPEVELVNLVLDVVPGGIDTAQSQLSHIVRLLAEHPDQLDAAARPTRPSSPSRPSKRRSATSRSPRSPRASPPSPIEYRGITFPRNTVVMVSAFHANRDGVPTPAVSTSHRPASAAAHSRSAPGSTTA